MNKIEKEVQRMLDVLGVDLPTHSHSVWENSGEKELDACTVGQSTVIREETILVPTIARPKQAFPGWVVERWVGRSDLYGGEEAEPSETLAECRTLAQAVAVALGCAIEEHVHQTYEEESFADFADPLEISDDRATG